MTEPTIENYQISAKLFEAKNAAFYKAVDLLLNREVCVKVFEREFLALSEESENLRFEAGKLAKINHPCVPTLYSIEFSANQSLIIEEFFEGEKLSEILLQKEKFNYRDSFSLFAQILDCLEHTHELDIAHGEIKTDKIFLTVAGDVKILGFGRFKVNQNEKKEQKKSTEEILSFQSKKSSDVYAAGMVFYELLTGRNLSGQLLENQEISILPDSLNPEIPGEINELLISCLERRFTTANEFREALNRVDLDEVEKKTGAVKTAQKSDAVCSLDFSQNENKFSNNIFVPKSVKNKSDKKSPVRNSFLGKRMEKQGIFTWAMIGLITVIHFGFQFSLINSENFRSNRDLVKSVEVNDQASRVEESFDKKVFAAEPEKVEKEKTEIINNEFEKPEKTTRKIKPKTVVPAARPSIGKSPPVLERKEPAETRAERLRRAEKILTGA